MWLTMTAPTKDGSTHDVTISTDRLRAVMEPSDPDDRGKIDLIFTRSKQLTVFGSGLNMMEFLADPIAIEGIGGDMLYIDKGGIVFVFEPEPPTAQHIADILRKLIGTEIPEGLFPEEGMNELSEMAERNKKVTAVMTSYGVDFLTHEPMDVLVGRLQAS